MIPIILSTDADEILQLADRTAAVWAYYVHHISIRQAIDTN